MARISVDPTEDKNKPKFFAFRKRFNWPPYQAYGFLCAFWVSILESEEHETGDISNCTPEFIADRVGVGNVDPGELWEALLQGYVEARPNGRYIVQDWIEIAGPHLRQKYHNRDNGRERLAYIWSLHGRIYGREANTQKSGESKEESEELSDDSHLTVSSIEAKKRTIEPQKTGPLRSSPPTSPSSSYPEEDLKAYIPPSEGKRFEKSLSDVSFLQTEYLKKLTERLAPEKPTGFSWDISGANFKKMLKMGLTTADIAVRFDPWFASTQKWINERSYDVRDFKTYFPRLKDGPISNQVKANGRTIPYEGAATFTTEQAEQFDRELEKYQRSTSQGVE